MKASSRKRSRAALALAALLSVSSELENLSDEALGGLAELILYRANRLNQEVARDG